LLDTDTNREGDAARGPRRFALPSCRGERLLKSLEEECLMNLTLTGHHLDVTPAIRAYVTDKLERVTRHFDHVIDVSVVLTVEKLVRQAEATVHLSGKDLHATATDEDMYAAIDALADKLDRMVVKHKELLTSHRPENGGVKRNAAVASEERAE
jgi:putative sigma-54 modulation protein